MARYGEDMSRERWRDNDRDRSGESRDRDDNRGFFERAGEEVRSWFRDDDDRGSDRWSENNRSNWDRDRSNMSRGSSWDRDQDRSQWSSQSSGGRGQGRSNWENEGRSTFGGMSQGGQGRSGGGWDRDQNRSSGWSGESGEHPSPSKRDFGGFRDEDDFRPSRGQHRRDHAQSWGKANRGENDSLGYSQFSGTLGGFGNQTFGSSEHDHYRNWRDREMSKLDDDYREYCRDREQKFNQDFDSWRSSRSSRSPSAVSNASGGDLGAASNAGVGTTTGSMTGSGGPGSALGGATGTGGSIQSDTTGSTETAGAGSGRSGSRSRS